ncbi:MAG: PEP-CTERM sorting domain-containing protein [Methyloversatilis sp.]|nr:PEP-CTERM sorting domain-containing protein [Methyloversatilis sp.]
MRAPLRFMHLAAALLSFHVTAAHAIHFDVAIGLDQGPVAGSRITVGAYGDLPFEQLPIDVHTGYMVFPGDFGDFEGGPKSTDDPGFQAFPGSLSGASGARDFIGFKAVGTLLQWDAAGGTWSAADDGVGIRLYGAVPPAVANAYIQSLINPRLAPPGAAANFEFYSQGTLFTGAGIEGPVAATIDDANANGGFHAHLDWFIEGAAPSSAYMVTLHLTDATSIGGRGRYVDSDPFHVVFNYGLSAEQYETAFMSRVSLPVPEPSSWALMVAGLVLTTSLARRVRS